MVEEASDGLYLQWYMVERGLRVALTGRIESYCDGACIETVLWGGHTPRASNRYARLCDANLRDPRAATPCARR